jgi:hypothetical protein
MPITERKRIYEKTFRTTKVILLEACRRRGKDSKQNKIDITPIRTSTKDTETGKGVEKKAYTRTRMQNKGKDIFTARPLY